MARYFVTAALRAFVSLFVASLVVFVLLRASGDPVRLLMGPQAASEEQVARVRASLGLDRPLPEQYVRFVSNALRGDFGHSIPFRRPAIEMVLQRLPATLQLVGVSFLMALMIALPLGVYSAVHRGSILDHAARTFAALGQATPPFWVGLVLIFVFAVHLRLLPTSGRGSPAHLVLPTITLGWYITVALMRLTRSSMLDVLGSEYVKLARMKGMYERQVIWKHAFRNAALPVITFAGLMMVGMINGAVVVEVVFAWPGLGSLIVQAVLQRDFPVVQAGVLFITALYAISGLVVDVLYGYFNPRIRVSG
jgi:peptide/nickel transport system permease protein